MKTYKMIIIGAGGRGVDYSVHLVNMRDQFEIVGVADPIKERRDNLKNMFGLTDDQLYENWEEILSKPKFADIAIPTPYGTIELRLGEENSVIIPDGVEIVKWL